MARLNANHEIIQGRSIRVTWKRNPWQCDPEANVFLRNVEDDIDIKQLDGVFSKFGPIFSSKIARNDEGKSLKYAYVQFEKKESAFECFKSAQKQEDNGFVFSFDNHILRLEKFIPSTQRVRPGQNNIYVKALKGSVPEQITESLKVNFKRIIIYFILFFFYLKNLVLKNIHLFL